VADFCSNCLEVREFELLAYGIGDHAYFVSLGLTETQGHLKKCCTCHLPVVTNLARYEKIASRRPTSLNSLVHETFPTLLVTEAERIRIANEVKASAPALTPAQRQNRMIEVLQVFNPLVEHRYANWSDFDRQSGSGCLLTLAAVFVCINRGCASTKSDAGFKWWIEGAFYTLIAGFVVTLILTSFGPSRFMRREILPGIAHGLAHLRSSEQEIADALKRGRDLRLKIARKVHLPSLMREFEKLKWKD
jgi:hypothetical protein